MNMFKVTEETPLLDGRIDTTVEDIRERFGDGSIKNAVVLGKGLKKPPRGVLPK